MKRRITLQAWAEAHFDPPPSRWTLRKWAREYQITPLPEKVGRTYYVPPDARYTGPIYGSKAA